uniref:Uncharacterized protein n=1 Tax=Tetranychus urticae TaxID=32264 RepID=T1JTI0_TETUR
MTCASNVSHIKVKPSILYYRNNQVFDDLKAALDNIKILGDGDYSEDRLKDAIEPIRYRFPSNVTDQQILADLKTLLAQIERLEISFVSVNQVTQEKFVKLI